MTLKYYYKEREKAILHTLQTAFILGSDAECQRRSFTIKMQTKGGGIVHGDLLHFHYNYFVGSNRRSK